MRKCTVCAHKKRETIDKELLAGRSLRDIAERFGTSKAALHRHRSHVAEHVAQAHEAAEVCRADTLLDQVRAQRDRAERLAGAAERILNDALADGDRDTALNAVRAGASAFREVRGVLELLGKVMGELEERQRVEIVGGSVDLSVLSDRELELIAKGDPEALAKYQRRATPAMARQLMRTYFGDVGPQEDTNQTPEASGREASNAD